METERKKYDKSFKIKTVELRKEIFYNIRC